MSIDFVNPQGGDLALTTKAGRAIDSALKIPDVEDDIRGHPRPERPDVGAWERD